MQQQRLRSGDLPDYQAEQWRPHTCPLRTSSRFPDLFAAKRALRSHLHKQFCSDPAVRQKALRDFQAAKHDVLTEFTPLLRWRTPACLPPAQAEENLWAWWHRQRFAVDGGAGSPHSFQPAGDIQRLLWFTSTRQPSGAALRCASSPKFPSHTIGTKPGLLASCQLCPNYGPNCSSNVWQPASLGNAAASPGAQILDACAAVQNIIHKTSEWRVPCIIFKAEVEKAFWLPLLGRCVRNTVGWAWQPLPHEVLALAQVLLHNFAQWALGALWRRQLWIPAEERDQTGRYWEPFCLQPHSWRHAPWSGQTVAIQCKDFPMVLPFVRVLHSVAYMDDLLLLAPNLAQLEKMIEDLQTSLASAALTINRSKCKVAVKSAHFYTRIFGTTVWWNRAYSITRFFDARARVHVWVGHRIRSYSRCCDCESYRPLCCAGWYFFGHKATGTPNSDFWTVILKKHGWILKFEPVGWPNKP